MYTLARQLLFKLSPETSHDLSLDLIGAGGRLGLNGLLCKAPARLPVNVMGLEFPNPVGLAAGLDKNGAAIDGFAQLGFGFVEIGTITPRPQPGNPKPRLFRLPEAEAIINRMGFNNLGVDHLLARVAAAKYKGVLGINIGKNFDTPVERAVDDYLICLDKVYAHASYVTVNVSSPNTPGLRSLQFGDSLKQLLEALRVRQDALTQIHGKRVPLAIKIAPDRPPASSPCSMPSTPTRLKVVLVAMTASIPVSINACATCAVSSSVMSGAILIASGTCLP